MEEKFKNFLENKNSVLWVSTIYFEEFKKIFDSELEKISDKKVFKFVENKFLDDEGVTLYSLIDKLYAEGIRKTPIYLLIENSYEELGKEENINYIKEIVNMKKNMPTYNLNLVILDENTPFENLKNEIEIIVQGIKEKENYKDWVEEHVRKLAKENNKKISQKDIRSIINKLDFNIENILGIKSNNFNQENSDMIFVKGGKYKPLFLDRKLPNFYTAYGISDNSSSLDDITELKVNDLLVSKYAVTQELFEKIMGGNPSKEKGSRCPVTNVGWYTSLKFCNKLSEKEGLVPTYHFDENNILKIQYVDGSLVSPDLADFSKTEGYRLPLEVEWEWFARGGEIAIQNDTFDYRYSGSDNKDEVAWDDWDVHTVGTKKPNQLGLYDCSGNVWEWCYDSDAKGYINPELGYRYDEATQYKKIKGGACWHEGGDWNIDDICALDYKASFEAGYTNNRQGFRIVRTV